MTDFISENSADPDEMPPTAEFHLGLQCLPKYLSSVSRMKMVIYISSSLNTPQLLTGYLNFAADDIFQFLLLFLATS